MIEDEDDQFVGPEPKSSASILASLKKAEDAFRDWNATCQTIDRAYSREGYGFDDSTGWRDSELDLFWSSFEVLKPAVYARPPQPVVEPLFKDTKPLNDTTAELLERAAVSVFKRTSINDNMTLTRDDLIFAGRGVLWCRHEVDGGEHSVCIEHKDRLDFLHEPARYWSEVGWVAGGAWLSKKDMRKRFFRKSGNAYKDANYTKRRDRQDSDSERQNLQAKAKVWEVWHKADNKVYWVSEGCTVLLDEDRPEVTLTGFFPCPKPAYATLARRSLIPVPDWERYAIHFRKISELTRRIYSLLDKVRMKGLIPAGGDVGDAVETLLMDDNDDQLLIPVAAASMMTAGAEGFVSWMPLAELATAITGLIDARTQLINDFYQLSGISDIMRGATDADETLGAQELKSQYGSVRVREKSEELQRVAADAVKIAAEIIAEKFPQKVLLEMTGMEIPSKADIEKRVKEVEDAAKDELEALGKKAQEEAQQAQGREGFDPAQAQAAFQEGQQQIFSKYGPMLAQVQTLVPIEDVMQLLRDDRARAFVFEIESSSTILTDEMAEKKSRNDFLTQFTNASQGLSGLVAMGEPGAKLAGALLKFVLAPYRAGRQLDGAIEEFIEAAPDMAAAAAGAEGDSDALTKANQTLADAEMAKAQAALEGVKAKSVRDQADMTAKMTELQQKAADAQIKAQGEADKLRLQVADLQTKEAKNQAEVDLIRAQTAAILDKLGLDVRKQDLEEYKVATGEERQDQEMVERQQERDMQMQRHEVEDQFRERGESRADQAFASEGQENAN